MQVRIVSKRLNMADEDAVYMLPIAVTAVRSMLMPDVVPLSPTFATGYGGQPCERRISNSVRPERAVYSFIFGIRRRS